MHKVDQAPDALSPFLGRRLLFLQGPLGPFFRRLACELKSLNSNTEVHKINFNAGDVLFYPEGLAYRAPLEQWYDFLTDYIQTHGIEEIILFGDCRPIHVIAKAVAMRLGVGTWVFEEGYLRPNHITLESNGVNGHSPLSKDPNVHQAYMKARTQQKSEGDINDELAVIQVGKTFWCATAWAVMYYTAATIGRCYFPHYQHHRPLGASEAWPWLRGVWRKQKYRFLERGVAANLKQEWAGRYYFVPLQVYNDAQLIQHSHYSSIEEFIEEVLVSFAKYAPRETLLVIKQHPFDRPYSDYTALVHRLAGQYDILERVLLIHDQYLPDLLKQSLGIVVVNSTVGLSAVEYRRPVKACGMAVYDVQGVTYQGSIDCFWSAAEAFVLDDGVVDNYLRYLVAHSQHNGSFYRRIKTAENEAGVLWRRARAGGNGFDNS